MSDRRHVADSRPVQNGDAAGRAGRQDGAELAPAIGERATDERPVAEQLRAPTPAVTNVLGMTQAFGQALLAAALVAGSAEV